MNKLQFLRCRAKAGQYSALSDILLRVCRWGVNRLQSFLGPLVDKGLSSVMLFGVPLQKSKDDQGQLADDPEGGSLIYKCIFY